MGRTARTAWIRRDHTTSENEDPWAILLPTSWAFSWLSWSETSSLFKRTLPSAQQVLVPFRTFFMEVPVALPDGGARPPPVEVGAVEGAVGARPRRELDGAAD